MCNYCYPDTRLRAQDLRRERRIGIFRVGLTREIACAVAPKVRRKLWAFCVYGLFFTRSKQLYFVPSVAQSLSGSPHSISLPSANSLA
jgi:hypothetical protein